MRRLLMVLLLAATGCAAAEPLAGVGLPPASLPQEYETSVWAIAFSHDFAPGQWTDGGHTYTLGLDCPPALDAPLATDQLSFMANSRTQVLQGRVYIRLVGLSDTQTGPRNVITIGTGQPTTAVITLIGVTEEAATAAAEECAGEMVYDSAFSVGLLPGDPFRP